MENQGQRNVRWEQSARMTHTAVSQSPGPSRVDVRSVDQSQHFVAQIRFTSLRRLHISLCKL